MERHGFRVLRLKEDRRKSKMVWLLPFVWLIHLCGRLASKKRRKVFQLDETIKDEIVMGGNTLIIMGERVV
jgi:hypothetical protein